MPYQAPNRTPEAEAAYQAAKAAQRQKGATQRIAHKLAAFMQAEDMFETRVGNRGAYFTTGQVNLTPETYVYTAADGSEKRATAQVMFCVTLNNVRDAAQAEAATVESFRSQAAKLTPDQVKAEIERLMAQLPNDPRS